MGFEALSDDVAPMTTDALAMAALQQLQAERAQVDQGQQALQQPAFVQADCVCRGGVWIGGDTGYCVPAKKPAGNFYDVGSRGCAPLPGFGGAGSKCSWRGVNVCLIAAALAGGAVLWLLLRKKKPQAEAAVGPAGSYGDADVSY